MLKAIKKSLLLLATTTSCFASGKPNFVVVLLDDAGYGDIAPFGSKINRTPNLDRMAKEGMKLTSFYCAPVCSASRAQLLTGCYAKRVSVGLFEPVSRAGLNPDENTVAELLKKQGYHTALIGKWHLGDQPEFLPTRQGFDRFFGVPYSNDQGADGKPDHRGIVRPPLPLLDGEKVVEAPADQGELTARLTEKAVEFIRENRGDPFFLYFAPTATHVPINPGTAFRGRSPHGLYSDWVEEADWSVGRVLDTIRDLGLERDTLVLFTSDNGPWLSKGVNAGTSTPLTGGKFSCWEGGSREPTIAWWPGTIPAGSSSDAVLSQIDFLPTAVNLAGGKVPPDRKIDGKDIMPVLKGQSRESPHEALFYWDGQGLAAVRSGPWKLQIRKHPEPKKDRGPASEDAEFAPRLFNLDDDMAEARDVAAQHPDVVLRLQGYIAEMGKDLGLRGEKAPGIRPAGRVGNPLPLVMKSAE
jgi:arylsulfatase A-like enzyme